MIFSVSIAIALAKIGFPSCGEGQISEGAQSDPAQIGMLKGQTDLCC